MLTPSGEDACRANHTRKKRVLAYVHWCNGARHTNGGIEWAVGTAVRRGLALMDGSCSNRARLPGGANTAASDDSSMDVDPVAADIDALAARVSGP